LADAPTLFVAGGGSGAESLNAYIGRHLADLLGAWQIIHQAGTSPNLTTTADVLRAQRQALPGDLTGRYVVDGYFDGGRVNTALRCATVTLARAGAGFVNEVGQLGGQTILVPYPYSVRGEQDALARSLVPTGRVVVWEDQSLRDDDPPCLAQLLNWTPLRPTGQASPVRPTEESVRLIAERLQALLA
jgi:UDP-N-acetylglucosamine--N-acetylmuramyl-(pentapeptide) pyrophosphoryl-undecaprenol N-acetylglucosamine transferase